MPENTALVADTMPPEIQQEQHKTQKWVFIALFFVKVANAVTIILGNNPRSPEQMVLDLQKERHVNSGPPSQ
jgi:hypothetical protein